MTKPAVIAVQSFAARPEAVYDAILSPDMIGKFMFGELLREEKILRIDLDPRVGGAFSYKVKRGKDEIDHVGRFLELDRPNRIAFSWSIMPETDGPPVTIDIAPTPEGCRVTLAHEMAPGWEKFADRARGAWEKMLGVLSTLVPPRPRVAGKPDRISLIFIKAEPQAVWDAVVSEAISAQYFFGNTVHVASTPGGPFSVNGPDGKPSEAGIVLVNRPPNILRVTWKPQWSNDIPQCEVEWLVAAQSTDDDSPLTRLTVNEYHQNGVPPQFLDAGRTGWAIILSGIKSILETGKPLPPFKPDAPTT
jgi:uncharacterized protein YndB with AHSA1/START domain